MLRFFFLKYLFKVSCQTAKKLNWKLWEMIYRKAEHISNMTKNLDPEGKMFQMNVYFLYLIRGKCKEASFPFMRFYYCLLTEKLSWPVISHYHIRWVWFSRHASEPPAGLVGKDCWAHSGFLTWVGPWCVSLISQMMWVLLLACGVAALKTTLLGDRASILVL